MKELASTAFGLERGGHDRLLERIGGARFVLLGQATHGTDEFYRERAVVTRRLLEEKGFDAVAIEADWPDAHRVSRYVRRHGLDRTAEESLGGFRRFPHWMWRNTAMLEFVRFLHEHDLRRPRPAGVYGLDLYSLHASMEVVVDFLDRVDPRAAARARDRYASLEHVRIDAGASGSLGLTAAAEQQITEQLLEMRARTLDAIRREDAHEEEQLFHVEQNARLVHDAAAYYRSMLTGTVEAWNLRARHMADTLDAVAAHLDRKLARPSKIVVWAHNAHVGDGRATARRAVGEVTVGQLARERHGKDAFLVGFTTYGGTVTSASEWGGKAERTTVRDAFEESHEHVLHAVAEAIGPRFVLPTLHEVLRAPRLARAIGVVYRPRTERESHWRESRLADQFDALVHIDRTRAVEPLEKRPAPATDGEPAKTYPSGV